MKPKIISFFKVTAVVILLAAAFAMLTSCGGDAELSDDFTLDVNALAEAVATEITYDDSLYKVDDYVVDMLYECGELSVSASAWSGTGATAEAVAVFEAADKDGAKNIAEILENYRNERAADFSRYTVGEIEKLRTCVIRSDGKYALFSVSPDSSAANAIIDRFIAEARAAD